VVYQNIDGAASTEGTAVDLLFTARRYVSAVCCYLVSVCPSVSLSVWQSQAGTIPKTTKQRIMQTTPYDSTETLVFSC